MVIFLAELLIRRLIPYAATVTANFYPHRPMSASGIRPAFHGYKPIVNDHCVVDWAHDSGGDGHVLDGKAVAVGGIVFAYLRGVVEILGTSVNTCSRYNLQGWSTDLFLLYWGFTGAGDGVDSRKPLHTPGEAISVLWRPSY